MGVYQLQEQIWGKPPAIFGPRGANLKLFSSTKRHSLLLLETKEALCEQIWGWGVHELLDRCPCNPSCTPGHPNQTVLWVVGGFFFHFCSPTPLLLWDEKPFINDFRLISLPSRHRCALPLHHALKTVFCPGLKEHCL